MTRQNTNPRGKARAVFLAAVMVLSAVTMTVTFAGTVAASHNYTVTVDQAGTPADIETGDSAQVIEDINISSTNGFTDDTAQVYINVSTLAENGVDLSSLGVGTVTMANGTLNDKNTYTAQDGSHVVRLTVVNATGSPDAINISSVELTGLGTSSADAATGLSYYVAAEEGTSTDSEHAPSGSTANTSQTSTFNISSVTKFDVTNVDSPRVARHGASIDVSVTVENIGNETGTQNVTLNFTADTGQAADVRNQSVTLDPGQSETVTFSNVNTSQLPGATQSQTVDYDVIGKTDNDSASTRLKVGSSSSGGVQISVSDDLRPEQGETTKVALYVLEDYEEQNGEPVVGPQFAVKETDENGEVNFRNLAVGNSSNNPISYVAVAGFNDPNFESTTTTLNLYDPTQTSASSTLFIDRVVDADRLTIDSYDPSNTVETGENLNISTLVETLDRDPNAQNYSALADSTVEVTDITKVSGPATISGIQEGDQVDSDNNGLATFSGITTQENFEEVDKSTTFEITFEALNEGSSAVSNVTATATVTFTAEPPSGNGVIAGSVYEYEDDRTISPNSASSTSDLAEGVSVHAVSLDRMAANTLTVNNANSTAYVRVYDEDAGEYLSVETDYLFTNGIIDPDDTDLGQNTSIVGTGFNAEDTDGDGDVSFSVHVLEPGNYTVEVSADGSFAGPSEYTFEATNNLTFDATEERYADVPADHTTMTDEDGEFRLTSLYTNGSTGLDYVTIAADQNPSLGFANAQGYEVVNVEPSADQGETRVSLDVQQVDVQADSVNITNVGTLPSANDADADYENDIDEFADQSDAHRQEIPRDGSTVDVIKVRSYLSENNAALGANVTISYAGGGFSGSFLNTSVGGDVIDHSADEITIDTGDGNAVVFLKTDQAGYGNDVDVTVSAEMENAGGTDATDKKFIGVLKQSYKSASITGVVTDENDNPVDARIYVTEMVDPSNNIRIEFTPNDVDQLENFTATLYDTQTGSVIETVNLTADEMANFRFQGFDSDLSLAQGESAFTLLADRRADRTTLSPVPALGTTGANRVRFALTGVSQTGATGTSVSTAVEVNRTSTASIVISGAEDAFLEVSNLDPSEATITSGENLTVSVNVENIGDLTAQQDVSLSINGSEYDSETVSLDPGISQTIELMAENVDLDAGTYTYTVASDDDSVEGNLTVESQSTNNTSWWDPYVNNQGVVDTSGLRTAIDDWRAGSLDTGDLQTVIDSWRSGTPVEDL